LIRKAAVLLCAVAFLVTGAKAEAGVTVSGASGWLEAPVKRSLEAVWQEVVKRGSLERERLVELVVKRLFPGLVIKDIRAVGENLFITLDTKESKRLTWSIVVEKPELPRFLERPFEEDISGLKKAAAEMLDSLPLEVFRWAGEDFQISLVEHLSRTLPGWKPSFVISRSEGNGLLEIGFTPEDPVVIAFSPRLSSRSLPLILQSKLEDETLEVTSEIVGLPGAWIGRHKEAVETYVASSLENRWAAEEMRGKVDVDIQPDRIAPVDVDVESDRYTLRAWLGVYAGADDRYPELGVYAGRRLQPFSGWDIEGYGEFLVELNDGSIDPRIGLRWKWTSDIWLGIERSFDDDEYWGRIWFEEILPRLYAWGRFREDGETEAGIGWRIGEHISWEIYYDSRDDEEVSLRIMGNL
jgi:hypothetical protein